MDNDQLQVIRVAAKLRNQLKAVKTSDDAEKVMEACNRYKRKYGSWPEIAEVKAQAKARRDQLKREYF